MKLPNLPFLNKKPSEEYFISLILKPKNIVAILLKKNEANITIVSTKSVSLDLSSGATEDIISAADEAISSIELSLDEGYVLEKTIFSVPYSWSDDEGNIKKERLLQLKKLSVELALKPMGFIISIEALIKFFQDKEGIPLSAIFVEEAKDKVFIYLVKGGNIIEAQSGEIDGEVEVAVERTLKKVENFDKLPPKMILLYHEDIESRHQNFLNHQWTKDLPFLHLPQISLMEKGFENEAVVDAIASQLNASVGERAEVAGAEIMEGEASSMAGSGENFGFLKEKDINEVKEEYVKEKEEPVINVSNSKLDNEEVHDYGEERTERKTPGMGLVPLIAVLPNKLLGIFKAPGGASSKIKRLFIPILAVLLFVVFMAAYYLLFLKAEVVVFLAGDSVSDEVLVTLSEEEETSFEDEVLHIDTIEQEVEGSVTKDTTGVEEVGENATGEVTILSSLNENQTIDAGTVLTSSNGLEFILDDDVNIASSSGVSDIKSSKGSVTSTEFGREYNLPSGTKFSVEGFSSSSVEAENEVAFSGGSSEERQIVSEEDVESLEEQLIENLFEQAVDEADSRLNDDEQIIAVMLDAVVEDENYSASVGDEASSLKLDGRVTYTLGIYSINEAQRFIDEARGEETVESFSISEDDSEIRLTDIEESTSGITGMLYYDVVYKSEVDITADEITGKSVGSATELLKEKDGVSDVNIVIVNKLPLLPSLLPLRSDQIEITTRTEG